MNLVSCKLIPASALRCEMCDSLPRTSDFGPRNLAHFSPHAADNQSGEVCHAGGLSLDSARSFPFSPGQLLLTRHSSLLSKFVPLDVCRASTILRLWPLQVSCHSSLATSVVNNCLSFHEHNGKATITSLFFTNIMEGPFSDIFTPFVFNNIMEDTFIFSPRVFSLPNCQK